MSFMDNLGKFASGAGKVAGNAAGFAYNELQKKAANIQKYMDKYEDYDDKELIEKYKRTSGDEKMACGKLLRDRGYGNQNND